MRERLTQKQISHIMNHQRQIWQGTPMADDIIKDCCHALANAFCLDVDQRKKFMAQCGWSTDHQAERAAYYTAIGLTKG